MSDYAKVLEELCDLAKRFIPSDLAEKLSERMSDAEKATCLSADAAKIINELCTVEGITPAASRDMKASSIVFTTTDGTVVSRWKNLAGCEHAFVSDKEGKFLFGGFTGWVHNEGLLSKEDDLRKQYS